MSDGRPRATGTRGEANDEDTAWWRSAVIYQLYLRSFADGTGDGVGDLAGARAHLAHLARLGVDAVWLNPWYASPLADGGYDVADYRAIEPSFGTLADAEAFIADALALGIRTIIDIVPNHVSDQHPWFVDALAAEPGAPERDRFWFRPGRGADGSEPPNNWRTEFHGEPAWTRTTGTDGEPGEWYLHLFTPRQPDLNWTHPDVRAEHEAILRFWFDRGAAGVRIDSAALAEKDPSLRNLPDAPGPGEHPYVDRDEIHELYRSWRKIADSYDPPRVLIGEVWLPDRRRFADYLRPDELHSAFNFNFMTAPWDAATLRRAIVDTLADHAPVGATPTWVLANHDVTRAVTRYGRDDTSFAFRAKRIGTPTDPALGLRRARAAALLAMALPGCFYVYQGDELGLPEVEDLPPERIQDPMHFESGGIDPGRDGCRVPLPWSGREAPYGFSPADATNEPWLPQPADWGELTVDAQRGRPGSTLTLYERAIELRRHHWRDGDVEWLDLGDDDLLAFRRGATACVVNFAAEPRTLSLSGSALLSSDGDVASPDAPTGDTQRLHRRLPADTAIWIGLTPDENSPPHPATEATEQTAATEHTAPITEDTEHTRHEEQRP